VERENFRGSLPQAGEERAVLALSLALSHLWERGRGEGASLRGLVNIGKIGKKGAGNNERHIT
jgi:hypothetical protein